MSSVPRLSLDGPTAQIETTSFAAAAFGDVWLLYQRLPIIADDDFSIPPGCDIADKNDLDILAP